MTKRYTLTAWLVAALAVLAMPVQATRLLAMPAEGENDLPAPDEVDGPRLIGDDPAEAVAPTIDPTDPGVAAAAAEELTPLPATLGGMIGAGIGVAAGIAAVVGLGASAVVIAALVPAAIPVVIGTGVAALIAATLIPAFAGTGAGIGAMLTQGSFDLISVLSVLVFTAAIYITIAVVLVAIAALAALVTLFFAAVVGGGGSLSGCSGAGCNGCGNSCCSTASTTSSVHGGSACAQGAMLPPFAAVRILLGRDASPLAVYPTLGGMVGSFVGGVGGAAALGLTSWAIAGSSLDATDSNVPLIATAAAGAGFVLGSGFGAVLGGGVASLAATVPTQELQEIRGQRTDDDDYYYFED